MSWQLGAFLILAAGLAGGFAWYERSKPDARLVALVGTLAAFGALGRIAFAAIPNVKPTTDIVLISGYALGGAPGFVVGAVAALASNFFFGQGPWTPWQMAGWGVTGILGAALATVTRGRIGRWPLALISFVVGFAFTALQDVGDWVTYSDHSLTQLGVYVGKGIGFDFVHATGCLVFALAFGPALTHSLQRFRLRLNVVWAAPALLAAVVLSLHALAPPPAQAAASPIAYLRAAQNQDGGFGAAPGQPSSTLFSGWAALGLAAAGENPSEIRHGGVSLLTYLQSTRSQDSDPGSLERTILALRAGDVSAATLITRLEHDIRADGSVSEQTNLTAFGVLALRAAGVRPPARTIAWLVRQQDSDGGFNYATGGRGITSDVDDTGAVIQALAGTGHAAVLARAVDFIDAQENSDGGFPSQPGSASNAQSTAFAVQGLIASGRRANRGEGYLRSLISPSGAIDYAEGQAQTPVWVTAQAELALAGKPLPLAPLPTARVVPVAPRPPARTPRWEGNLATLAADAGVLAALVLAPVNM